MKDLKQLTNKITQINPGNDRGTDNQIAVSLLIIIILPELLSFPAQPHSRHHIP